MLIYVYCIYIRKKNRMEKGIEKLLIINSNKCEMYINIFLDLYNLLIRSKYVLTLKVLLYHI